MGDPANGEECDFHQAQNDHPPDDAGLTEAVGVKARGEDEIHPDIGH